MPDSKVREQNTPHTIRMHERDNVAIVANNGGLTEGTVLSNGLVLRLSLIHI